MVSVNTCIICRRRAICSRRHEISSGAKILYYHRITAGYGVDVRFEQFFHLGASKEEDLNMSKTQC